MNRHLRSAAWIALALIAPTFAVADDKSEEKWESLFDGKTLGGWEMLPLKKEKSTSKWEVVDGLLTGTGEPSMLFSPKGDYKNFRYRAELRINDGGNSGMYIRTEKVASFTKGYEIQVNSTHRDPIKTGSVYTMVHVYKILVPPGQFFTQEIECVDKNWRGKVIPHIKVTVNGDTLYEFLDHNKSFSEGHFAFQQHDPGSKVEIRKIEVIELPETATATK